MKQMKIQYVICFLEGQHENYSNVKTQVLLMEPLPNINKAFSLIMQQLRQHSNSRNLKVENKVLANTIERGY